ncbi:MAG: DUF2752 domain-containing protein [Planctomycetota bacterium]
MFGMDCPSCGLTRAFISISHGQFMRAWHFNPASFLVYAFVASQIPWRLFQLARIRRGRLPYFSPWLMTFPATAMGALIVQWIFRVLLAD